MKDLHFPCMENFVPKRKVLGIMPVQGGTSLPGSRSTWANAFVALNVKTFSGDSYTNCIATRF
jgi:hypothetical protein